MQLSEFRTIWSTFGGALFATGFVIGADWIFVVSGAPPSRHLSYNAVAIYVSAALAILGILVFTAALTDRIWLPGRARIRKDELNREQVLLYLAKFLGRGSVHMLMRETTPENYAAWTTNLLDFTQAAFGTHEVAVLIPGPATSGPRAFSTVCSGIQSLIIRGRQLPLKDGFDPFATPEPEWQRYLSGVTQDIERFVTREDSDQD